MNIKKKSTIFIGIVVLIFFTFSCIEEFRPELDNFDNLLVLDGKITNEPGPYTIKLSISSDVDFINIEALSNATVVISEEGGIEETLIEVNPGEYKTKVDGIQGKVGENYKISITTANGKKYESPYQELKTPTNIESIEGVVEYHILPPDNFETIGYQFYVNSETSPYEQDYYVWFLEATYKYRAQMEVVYAYEGYYRELEDPDSLRLCYVNYTINEVFTANTDNLVSPQISQQPLAFVSGKGAELLIRYSLLTKQYSVNEEAYNFWNAIEKQAAAGGSLYTAQPYQIKGNIKNINDDNEPVLGYFLVAGVSENRIFIDAPNGLPEPAECFINSEDLFRRLLYSFPNEWPIYLGERDGELGIVLGGCIDCTSLDGSSLEVPDFWEE